PARAHPPRPETAVRPPAAPVESSGERGLLTRDGTVPIALPAAAAEAAAVARLYGARAATGPAPTEAWFRQHAGQADLIHLATAGFYNSFRAMSSGVLLAVPPRPLAAGDTDHDGALEAWELMSEPELRLRAELVVLSACETGMGETVSGEGLVG